MGGDIGNDPNRHIDRISQKGPQESQRADLDPKAQPVVVTTPLLNQGAIFLIQMKIAGELLWGWFAHVMSIALFLCCSQVINRHR